MLAFRTERGRVESPSSICYFSFPSAQNSQQAKVVYFGVTFSVQSSTHCLLRAFFKEWMLNSISKLLLQETQIQNTEPTPQSDEVEHLGWSQSSQVLQVSKQFSDFWLPCAQWLLSCTVRNGYSCVAASYPWAECQSSRQSSLTPTHSCLPEWPM